MATATLTKKRIQIAQPGDVLKDEKVPGLQLRCFEKRKAWYFLYRTKDGKQRRPKIGGYPAFSLEDARRVARKMREQVALGHDPAEKRAAERPATVADLAQRYLNEWAYRRKKKASADADARLIDTYIKPALGKKPVADVTLEDVERVLERITNGDMPGQRKPAPIMANRVRALLHKMFNLAETRFRLRPQHTNPVRGTIRNRERPRRRHLTAAEFPRFREAVDELAEAYPARVAAILTVLFTGARVNEIVRARHEQLDGDRIWLDDHKTAGTIGDKPVVIPKKARALMQRYRVTDSPYIFGGYDLRPAWEKLRAAIDARDLQLRDLRRSFASVALSNGVTLDQVGKLFGHTSTQTTQGYAWMMEGQSKDVAERTAEAMELLMEG